MKWISVSDKLPEIDEDVLLLRKIRGKCFVGYLAEAKADADDDATWTKLWYDNIDGYLDIDAVTHWMPLPEPPTE